MLRIVCACGLLLVAMAARAQASGSVAVVSDDRYRGVSLSDGRPVLQLGAGFDAADGAYVGGFASGARLDGRDAVRWQAYGGRAGRFGARTSWDVGAQYTGFAGDFGRAYPELYAGIAGQRWGVRLSYAWHYFGVGGAWYAGVDGQQPLSTRLRVLGHAGWLRTSADGIARDAVDLRAGLAAHLGHFDLQLARSVLRDQRPRGGDGRGYAYADGGAYPVDRDALGAAWVVSVTRAW